MEAKSLKKLIKHLVDKKYPELELQDVHVVIEDLGNDMTDIRVYLITNHTYLPLDIDYKKIKNWVKEMGGYLGVKINLVSFAHLEN